MFDTPILFIIFNRPDSTRKVFQAIRNIRPARLYIAADAPRTGNAADIEKTEQARRIVHEIDWPCELKTSFQDSNLGCSLGPRSAFDWFFSKEEEGIILEDDCLPTPSFFLFCQAMLKKYRDDKRIISINGSNLGYEEKNGESYTFSRFMNMWGWATWRRCAREVDYSLADWKKNGGSLWTLYTRMRQHLFDTDINWYKYWKDKFDRTISQTDITWWDWQWIYHQTKTGQLSVVPARNLVTNIGFDNNATHTKKGENPAAFLPAFDLEFPLREPAVVKANRHYEEEYVKWVWCYHRRLPASFYLKQFLSSYLK